MSRKSDDDYVLDPEKDGPLIRGLQKYAEIAGIGGHPEYIWKSGVKNPDLHPIEDKKMITTLFKLKEENKVGVVYTGFKSAHISRKFMALTGMLVRGYKDAFYSPMGMYVAALMDSGNPGHAVTFIPDFIIEGSKETVPGWKKDIIFGLLMEKQSVNELMVLGIPEPDDIKKVYGKAMYDFLIGNYGHVEAKDID